MGFPPSASHTLDRIDNNKGYSPENCRWATRKTQARNTRATTYLTFNGIEKPLRQWAEEIGISAQLIHVRVRSGWSIEEALNPFKHKAFGRKKIRLTYEGKTLSVPEWSRETGLNTTVIHQRLRLGWGIEKVLSRERFKGKCYPMDKQVARTR